jgi:hypothetical protein
MKNIVLVIREKEAELERIKIQLIALRHAAPLLLEEGDNVNSPAASMTAAAGASTSGEGKTRGWP